MLTKKVKCKIDYSKDLNYVMGLSGNPKAKFEVFIVEDEEGSHLRFEFGGVCVGDISDWNLKRLYHRIGIRIKENDKIRRKEMYEKDKKEIDK